MNSAPRNGNNTPLMKTNTSATVSTSVTDLPDTTTVTLSATPTVAEGGSIVYTASINRGDYCMVKAGLAMMTKLFADRLANDGINVYEIRPGVIATDMTGGVKEKYDKLIITDERGLAILGLAKALRGQNSAFVTPRLCAA